MLAAKDFKIGAEQGQAHVHMEESVYVYSSLQ